jgi:hypothetical protein
VTARHIYIDETKERGYILVATVHIAAEAAALRKTMRSFVLRGQTRIHMAKESDQRRRAISDAICAAGVTATIYDAGRSYGVDQLAARAACLQAVINDIPAREQTLLVLEQDDSLIHWDKQFLYRAVRAAGLADTLRYEHHRAKSDLLLTIPDAIAWCWARGSPWRERITPAVSAVTQV